MLIFTLIFIFLVSLIAIISFKIKNLIDAIILNSLVAIAIISVFSTIIRVVFNSKLNIQITGALIIYFVIVFIVNSRRLNFNYYLFNINDFNVEDINNIINKYTKNSTKKYIVKCCGVYYFKGSKSDFSNLVEVKAKINRHIKLYSNYKALSFCILLTVCVFLYVYYPYVKCNNILMNFYDNSIYTVEYSHNPNFDDSKMLLYHKDASKNPEIEFSDFIYYTKLNQVSFAVYGKDNFIDNNIFYTGMNEEKVVPFIRTYNCGFNKCLRYFIIKDVNLDKNNNTLMIYSKSNRQNSEFIKVVDVSYIEDDNSNGTHMQE